MRVKSPHKANNILEAAIRTFASKGYYQTRIKDIALEANVADGTIYLYFSSKEDILKAVFDATMSDFLDVILEIDDKETHPMRKLEKIIFTHLKSIEENRDRTIIAQVELRHSVHIMGQFARTYVNQYLQILSKIIKNAIDQKLIQPVGNPRLIAQFVFGILDEMATVWMLSEHPRPLSQMRKEVWIFIRRGLGEIEQSKENNS